MRLSHNLETSMLKRCISVFNKRDQKRIAFVVLIQIGLGALDLLGVMLIGLIGALAVTGIQSSQPGNRVGAALKILHLEDYTFQEQTAILGIVATLVLIGRTMFSVYFTRKVLFFIGRRSAVISGNLVQRLLQQSSLGINSRTIQETIYSVTTGVVAVTLGVVGTSVAIIADVSLLLVMAAGLVFVDPVVAISTFMLFSGVGIALYKLMHGRAIKFGRQDAELNIRSNEKISEVLTTYREATVRNRRSYYASQISEARMDLSNVLAELSFMPTISKYVVEITMILGAVVISALQFALQDSKHAVATLAVFLAAGTRIAPAVLRVQQGAISIKSSMGSARPTLELIETLPLKVQDIEITEYSDVHTDFEPNIEISDLSFSYLNAPKPALTTINLSIKSGTTCAIVGPSGSGKTTLVDLILGMFAPASGDISVSGDSPLVATHRFPGAVGYVPQDVSIIQGTIRENIALGLPLEESTDLRINRALEAAHLLEFVKGLPNGVDTEVGPRGSKLSGGQRQRLGIARAMFTQPKLLILDESTSALDAQTEVLVSEAISSIPYEITTIVIAHRLSTVRFADQVVYLHDGKIQAKGNFESVRSLIPDFDNQAKLMGL
jgi:ABC-type multidrug transport system fused ATPase/permease subunit